MIFQNCPKYHAPLRGTWYLENLEILRAGIIAKYYVQVMLLFVIIEAEKFSVTHKRPFFLRLKKIILKNKAMLSSHFFRLLIFVGLFIPSIRSHDYYFPWYPYYNYYCRSLSFIEDYIQEQVLPHYGNTHTTTTVTSLQTTLYRHEARYAQC